MRCHQVPNTEEREWLPSDPLYTREEWKKIKSAINPISTGLPFSQIANMLIVCIGNYRCAVIDERPEQVTGFKFRSKENRKRLRKAIKALANVKGVPASEKKANRTEKGWLKTAVTILQEQSLRLRMLELDDAAASNEKVNKAIEWLAGNTSFFRKKDFDKVIDLAIATLKSQQNAASRSGRSRQGARQSLIKDLKLIWKEAKGSFPKVNTDCETGAVCGRFHDFVHAVFKPISENMNDVLDISGLSEAIKKAIYKK